MSDQKNINPEGTDDLLKQAFLDLDLDDPKNNQILNAMTATTLGIGNPIPQKPNSTLRGSASNFKIMLTAGAVVAITIGGSWVYLKNRTPQQNQNSIQVPVATKQDSTTKQSTTPETKEPAAHIVNAPVKPAGTISPTGELQLLTSADSTQAKGVPMYTEPAVVATATIKAVRSTQQDTSYRFPILTDKEIAANNKRKKKMFDAYTKLTLFAFPNIQACTFKYHGVVVSLQAYHLECAVVNNNMYRTFLSDLLIQGRKNDFLIAKVDQKQWTKVQGIDYGEYMRENYFSNATYNDYPVVNISRQGAEMFCKWIEEGIKDMVTERYKGMKAIVRIPTDAEWYYAATSGGKDTIYPWGTSSINAPYTPHGKDKGTNKKGCFLADFCLKKYTGNIDSMRECTDHPYKNAYTTTGFILGENIFTAPIYSYNPNPLGFYAMAGNVASMVNVKATDGTLTPGTRGGSWGSDAEHLKIGSPDEYAGQTGPSPFIGFRPVVILTGK